MRCFGNLSCYYLKDSVMVCRDMEIEDVGENIIVFFFCCVIWVSFLRYSNVYFN